MTGEVLALEDARLAFGSLQALDGISFALRPGEMLGLLGPDGAGKTTALRALLGLVPLDSGRAALLGEDPRAAGAAHRTAVGYLSQRFTLYGDLTVDENLAFFARLFRVRDFRPARERLLELTRLGPFRRLRADRLSGGMQKKLALACTLVHAPRVLLLDEPTTGVDPVTRREFWLLLSGLLAQGLSVLLTTPYLDEAERCGRVALMRAGRVLACDSPAALRGTFRHRLREVVCAPARVARDLLGREPRVAEVQLFGDRLHVVTRDPADGLEDLLARLPGVAVSAVRDVAPTLEDVFIRRIGEEASA
ncbi:ABC transporter ATP-binding protein [Anaeromyxobacter terrae]|uniref:ABC transporter ATP-binding protein n=1 Tax=Anaeromyxobacter terrae TaxID=2925406 RepID=UPI001F5AE26E|nr:ABC transporter ATP-binding protein [Anaeromyxobacter sp. SG22]